MAPHSYRDAVDPTQPQYISDLDILRSVQSYGRSTSKLLAEGRYRENVIRLQCRDLCRIGLMYSCSHDTFSITAQGENALHGERPPISDGLFEISEISDTHYPPRNWRLTDFGILDPETIKEINLTEFDEAENDEYGWVDGDPALTRRRIKNVKRFQLHRIIHEFPTNEPLPQQCAHWMRAFAGLHLFPDANHRTGMNTLQILVEESSCDASLPISKDIERFVLQSKLIRHLNSKIQFNTLWKRDEHYSLWHRYFRNLLCDIPDRHTLAPPDEDLRRVLRYAREIATETVETDST